MAKGKNNKMGAWAFIIGVIIALIIGLLNPTKTAADLSVWLISVLVILGLIVGFLNVATKDTGKFLIAITVLAILSFVGGAAGLGNVQFIGAYLVSIFASIMALIIPAGIVVGLKEVWYIAYTKP